MQDLVISQITSAAIVVYTIQLVKRSTWFPYLTEFSGGLNRVAAAVLAAVGAVGIHVAFDAKLGALTITGLSLMGVLHGGWHWANQYALQQLIYDTVQPKIVVPAPAPPLVVLPSGTATKLGI